MKTAMGYCIFLFGWISFIIDLPELAEKPGKVAALARAANDRLARAGQWLADVLPGIPLDLLQDGYWNGMRIVLFWPHTLFLLLEFFCAAIFGVLFLLLYPAPIQVTEKSGIYGIFTFALVMLATFFPKVYIYQAVARPGLSVWDYATEVLGASLARAPDPHVLYYTMAVSLIGAVVAYNLFCLLCVAAWRKFLSARRKEDAIQRLLDERERNGGL